MLKCTHKLSVAPMMDYTDRHCRFFHRILSKKTFLFTEMVKDESIINGPKECLLKFDDFEKPLALQLGGSNKSTLSEATRIGLDYGYDEINLNVGCPSKKVKSGNFGAVLMKYPDLVAECIEEMKKIAKNVPVSVKCRLGVDSQNVEVELPLFMQKIIDAGVDNVIIHARKALLDGLSPKQNRNVPPINYSLVYDIKKEFKQIPIHINGEIKSLYEVGLHLQKGVDGVMVGREAYNNPGEILLKADKIIFEENIKKISMKEKVLLFFPYIEKELSKDIKFFKIARHLTGVFKGKKGSKNFRKCLYKKNTNLNDLSKALENIEE